jgi:hypothetical protein
MGKDRARNDGDDMRPTWLGDCSLRPRSMQRPGFARANALRRRAFVLLGSRREARTVHASQALPLFCAR